MKGRYVAYPRHPLTHKQFAVRAHSQRELEALLHRIDTVRRDLRSGDVDPEEVRRRFARIQFGPITLARAAESYQRRPDISPETRDRVRKVIAGPLHDLALVELDALVARTLAPLFERLGRRLSRETVRTVWRTLTAVARHAAERGWLTREPWAPWTPRQRLGQEGRGLRECARSPAERTALVDAGRRLDEAASHYRGLEAKIAAGALLGLRQGELAGLRRYDLYPARSVVAVRRQWGDAPLKTGESAELWAPPELFAILVRHIERVERAWPSRDPAERLGRYVFEPASRGHYARGAEVIASADLRAAVRAAGLPSPERWTGHSLRDTFATIEARSAGGDLRALAARTRHRSVASLVRYLRAFERGRPGELAPSEPPRALPA
jgi:integrase